MRIGKSKYELIIIVLIAVVFVFSFIDTINALNGKHFIDIYMDKVDRGYHPIMLQLSMFFFICYFSALGYLILKDRIYRVGGDLYVRGIKESKIKPLFLSRALAISLKALFFLAREMPTSW